MTLMCALYECLRPFSFFINELERGHACNGDEACCGLLVEVTAIDVTEKNVVVCKRETAGRKHARLPPMLEYNLMECTVSHTQTNMR